MNNWSWLSVVWWLRHFVVTKRRRVERVCWGCSVDFTSNLSQTRSPIEWYSSRRWRDARTTLFVFHFFFLLMQSHISTSLSLKLRYPRMSRDFNLFTCVVVVSSLLCCVFFPPRHRTRSIVFKNSLAIATALSTAHEKSQWDTKAAACLKINLKTDLLLLKVNKNDIFFIGFSSPPSPS